MKKKGVIALLFTRFADAAAAFGRKQERAV